MGSGQHGRAYALCRTLLRELPSARCRAGCRLVSAPAAYANAIGGGYALHCAGCRAAVLACPDNAGVEFWPVDNAAGACECCGIGFTDCPYCGAIAGEVCAADCATYFKLDTQTRA